MTRTWQVDVRKTIEQILSQICPESDFATSSDFIADGMLDSFDIISLVSELDRTFFISIDGEEILPENFNSFGAIETLLGKHGITE